MVNISLAHNVQIIFLFFFEKLNLIKSSRSLMGFHYAYIIITRVHEEKIFLGLFRLLIKDRCQFLEESHCNQYFPVLVS